MYMFCLNEPFSFLNFLLLMLSVYLPMPQMLYYSFHNRIGRIKDPVNHI